MCSDNFFASSFVEFFKGEVFLIDEEFFEFYRGIFERDVEDEDTVGIFDTFNNL